MREVHTNVNYPNTELELISDLNEETRFNAPVRKMNRAFRPIYFTKGWDLICFRYRKALRSSKHTQYNRA